MPPRRFGRLLLGGSSKTQLPAAEEAVPLLGMGGQRVLGSVGHQASSRFVLGVVDTGRCYPKDSSGLILYLVMG